MARQGNIGRPVEILICDIAVDDESLCTDETQAIFRETYVIRPGKDVDNVTAIGGRHGSGTWKFPQPHRFHK